MQEAGWNFWLEFINIDIAYSCINTEINTWFLIVGKIKKILPALSFFFNCLFIYFFFCKKRPRINNGNAASAYVSGVFLAPNESTESIEIMK